MILDPSLWGTYAGTFADWEGEGVTEPYYQTPDGKVTLYAGHVIDVLREMPAESVNCVVTSPPYWSLRKYDCEPVVWGGDPNCPHTLEDASVFPQQRGGGPENASAKQLSNRGTVGLMGVEGGYTGKARWQHDGVSRQETPEAWVKGKTQTLDIRTQSEDFNTRWHGSPQLHTKPPVAAHTPATCRLCGAWLGQYGLEPTPELYVEHTLMWLREVKRVLRKDGTLWLNLGDGYASGSSGHAGESQLDGGEPSGSRSLGRIKPPGNGLKPKDAILMPFRVALAAQADGWWVRSVIIWAKPNPMPESCKDRPARSHEYIFLLTRSKSYWYDADAVREHGGNGWHDSSFTDSRDLALRPTTGIQERAEVSGHNCRSVWAFPTQGFPDAHFAVFPRELPERCIKAGCPEWVCPKCGKARARVTETEYRKNRPSAGNDPRSRSEDKLATLGNDGQSHKGYRGNNLLADITTTGWTDCGCGAGFVGGVVLDPFAGSGTTCEVAYHLGRTAIGIDASAKYLDMAIERVKQGALL